MMNIRKHRERGVKHNPAWDKIKYIVVDLFCGAGGTTIGYEKAFKRGNKLARVIACVNHDAKAIASHKANHKYVRHFFEDIRKLELTELIAIVEKWRRRCPNAKLILWGSLECTNFTKAKGGLPKNADSRTLAWELYRYITAIKPDYIKIENVVEFRTWGPVKIKAKKCYTDRTELCMIFNKKTKEEEYGWEAIPELKGEYFDEWRAHIRSMGYHDEWTEMNAADFGAYTSRNRLFGCFAKIGLPIVFPEPTHSKKPATGKLPWKPVKDVLDFNDTGESIFALRYIKCRGTWEPRIKSDPTNKRVLAGLIKYVAKGDKSFLVQTYSANSKGHNTFPTNKTYRTVTTRESGQLVQSEFLTLYYGTGGQLSSVNDTCPTVPTKDRLSLTTTHWLDKAYSGKANHSPVTKPCGTIMTTGDKISLATAETLPAFLMTNYSGGDNVSTVEQPCGSLVKVPKQNVVQSYLMFPQWGIENCFKPVNKPSPTLIASMSKTAPALILVEGGKFALKIDKWDTPTRIKIKKFMLYYGIADIKMRMLRIPELKQIQGFPVTYDLKGSQADQKKAIGNAVHKAVVIAWVLALVKGTTNGKNV